MVLLRLLEIIIKIRLYRNNFRYIYHDCINKITVKYPNIYCQTVTKCQYWTRWIYRLFISSYHPIQFSKRENVICLRCTFYTLSKRKVNTLGLTNNNDYLTMICSIGDLWVTTAVSRVFHTVINEILQL